MGRISAQLLGPLRQHGGQNGAKLPFNILRDGPRREQRPQRLGNARILQPVAVVELPQIDRRLVAQNLRNLLQRSQIPVQGRGGGLSIVQRQHDTIQRPAAAQPTQGTEPLVIHLSQQATAVN